MNIFELFFDNLNDTAKWVFSQQPIIIVLFLVFIALLLIFYATKTVSQQNTQDHEEKKMLLELFSDLKTAITNLADSQVKRNESLEVQIAEQKTTNRNLGSLNQAFADYHSSLADTIGVIFKNQITGRLDQMETRIDEIYDLAKNKPDCNDEILDRLNDLGKNIDKLNEYVSKEKDIA